MLFKCFYNLSRVCVCRLQYFALVVLIFIVEIVAGVLAFVYRADIDKFLYNELIAGIREHYPHETEPDTEGLRTAWGFLQSEVRIYTLLQAGVGVGRFCSIDHIKSLSWMNIVKLAAGIRD